MIAQASISDPGDRVRHQEISVATRGGRRRRPPIGSRRRTLRLAIVVQGGVVQGVYADRCGRLTVYLLDYDDLRGDDHLAERVGRTDELAQVTVEAGLARAVAEYRLVGIRQARLQRAAEAGR
jgi:hypothetical protein